MSDALQAQLDPLRRDARAIFTHALEACRIDHVFRHRVRMEGMELVIAPPPWRLARTPSLLPHRIDLRDFRDVLVIALGKAAAPMTTSLLTLLPNRPRVHGLCVAPGLPAERDRRIRWYASGHPLPNRDSFRAAKRALRLLRSATNKTLVLFLISGGGSTLFDLPLDRHISLKDTIAFHRALIASGAPIAEINTVRKHFSAVKGGRLAAAAPRATKFALLVVDVPPDQSDALASGPTAADPSTVDDCRAILAQYNLLEAFPPNVRRFFSNPDLPETPGDKDFLRDLKDKREKARRNGMRSFSYGRLVTGGGMPTAHITLLSNRDLIDAAYDKALSLGYNITVDNSCDDWPYDETAAYLLRRARELHQPGRPLCLLSGGEVTVRLGPAPGIGGRNQQLVLAAALHLEAGWANQAIVFLSAGSDGIDGNSPAAGALADPTTTSRVRQRGLDPRTALNEFDSFSFFSLLGDTIVTGPTANNLRDLRIVISA